jgi:ribosome biogenesis GTPase A
MKYLLSYFLVAVFYTQIIIAAETKEREILLFIGNPGVGKSTLINSLISKQVAKSGVSAGSGLTQYF